jgi:flagellar M-ring protein FliF
MAGFDVRRAAERGRQVMSGFTLGQKAVVVTGVVLLVASALFLGTWSSKPSYVPLFSNLAASDASAIVDKLTAQKEPYRLADSGTSVLVPQADVYKLRLSLSAQNLPSGGQSGYALLDKQGVTTSDFVQHVDYQRALEGEMARTIQAMDGVQSALVHLVVPSNDVFSADSSKPSASVLVRTSAGATLGSEQVQAIVHLVSSSVEGLQPGDVTVADGAGHVLSAPGVDAAASADAHAQRQQAFERTLQTSVQDMLATVVGAGHSVVRVNADLNLDQTKSVTQSYVPQASPNAAPLSQSTSTETYKGTGAVPASGVLGPDNTGSTPVTGSGASSNGTSYNKTVTDQQNAYGTNTTTTELAPGGVRRLSVAVLLDQNALKGTSVNQVRLLVSNAVGLQAARGDSVQVETLPFDATAAQQDAKALGSAAAAKKQGATFNLLKTGVLVLGLVLVLLASIRGARRVERTPLLLPAERLELEAARRALAAVDRRQLETSLDGSAVIMGDTAKPAVSQELTGLVDRQPEEVAQLLRGWLVDKR